MSWTVILVPHDFSPSADHALALAREEAKLHGARLVLLHALDLPDELGMGAMIAAVGPPISVRDYAITEAERRLDAIVADLEAAGLVASRVVRVGYPSDVILAYVEESNASLVAMGTHGRRGVRRMVIGSVAERVLRDSTVPVLAVREPRWERVVGGRE